MDFITGYIVDDIGRKYCGFVLPSTRRVLRFRRCFIYHWKAEIANFIVHVTVIAVIRRIEKLWLVTFSISI